MNELRDWLKDADPVGNEPGLSDADAMRMRRAIVEAGDAEPSPFVWSRGLWAVASVVVALTFAIGLSRSNVSHQRGGAAFPVEPSGPAAPQAGARRQVQWIAPGGTRVIWIFNADFQP